jgi:hypothetical protein
MGVVFIGGVFEIRLREIDLIGESLPLDGSAVRSVGERMFFNPIRRGATGRGFWQCANGKPGSKEYKQSDDFHAFPPFYL